MYCIKLTQLSHQRSHDIYWSDLKVRVLTIVSSILWIIITLIPNHIKTYLKIKLKISSSLPLWREQDWIHGYKEKDWYQSISINSDWFFEGAIKLDEHSLRLKNAWKRLKHSIDVEKAHPVGESLIGFERTLIEVGKYWSSSKRVDGLWRTLIEF